VQVGVRDSRRAAAFWLPSANPESRTPNPTVFPLSGVSVWVPREMGWSSGELGSDSGALADAWVEPTGRGEGSTVSRYGPTDA